MGDIGGSLPARVIPIEQVAGPFWNLMKQSELDVGTTSKACQRYIPSDFQVGSTGSALSSQTQITFNLNTEKAFTDILNAELQILGYIGYQGGTWPAASAAIAINPMAFASLFNRYTYTYGDQKISQPQNVNYLNFVRNLLKYSYSYYAANSDGAFDAFVLDPAGQTQNYNGSPGVSQYTITAAGITQPVFTAATSNVSASQATEGAVTLHTASAATTVQSSATATGADHVLTFTAAAQTLTRGTNVSIAAGSTMVSATTNNHAFWTRQALTNPTATSSAGQLWLNLRFRLRDIIPELEDHKVGQFGHNQCLVLYLNSTSFNSFFYNATSVGAPASTVKAELFVTNMDLVVPYYEPSPQALEPIMKMLTSNTAVRYPRRAWDCTVKNVAGGSTVTAQFNTNVPNPQRIYQLFQDIAIYNNSAQYQAANPFSFPAPTVGAFATNQVTYGSVLALNSVGNSGTFGLPYTQCFLDIGDYSYPAQEYGKWNSDAVRIWETLQQCAGKNWERGEGLCFTYQQFLQNYYITAFDMTGNEGRQLPTGTSIQFNATLKQTATTVNNYPASWNLYFIQEGLGEMECLLANRKTTYRAIV